KDIVSQYGPEAFRATGIECSPELTLYRPVGCESCARSGYKGRVGIYELMAGSSAIRGLIKKRATTEEILRQSSGEGMTTLKQDAIAKVFLGVTDIHEVNRVCVNP
ncbi:type II/IV secretion system protein, partial [Thermodesulfobacteriota bacterium]